jgi:GAF domain-containing protein
MDDSEEAIARDVAIIGRIGAVPSMLRVICKNTGLGFAAVARVTDGTWTACAVQDDIQFGLLPGGQLDVHTTLCSEARAMRRPVVIDHASLDPVYREHHTPRIYNIESYISVPIVLSERRLFRQPVRDRSTSRAGIGCAHAYHVHTLRRTDRIATGQREPTLRDGSGASRRARDC